LGKEAAKHNQERDEREMTRQIAPLVPADDAVIIDSTHLSQDEVVAKIVALFLQRREA
jgi:cytidylate kinase